VFWHVGSSLVIIRNFDYKGVLAFPNETNAVLVVDSNAVLALAVACQEFQVVSGDDRQIV